MQNETLKFAELYRATSRTISRWKSEGAPLADAAKMRQWLGVRKHLPSGTKAWLLEQADLSRNLSSAATEGDTSSAPAQLGAGNALKRLEQAEAEAFTALQHAIRGGDPFAVKLARESWLKIGDSLRRYDLQVDQLRRSNGELIPRDAVEDALQMFGTFWQWAWHQLRCAAVPTIAGVQSMPEIDRVLENMGNHGLLQSLAGYTEWTVKAKPDKARIYSWMTDALRKGLEAKYHPWLPAIEARQHLWREMLEGVCAEMGLKPKADALAAPATD